MSIKVAAAFLLADADKIIPGYIQTRVGNEMRLVDFGLFLAVHMRLEKYHRAKGLTGHALDCAMVAASCRARWQRYSTALYTTDVISSIRPSDDAPCSWRDNERILAIHRTG
jgi:hypothetical protein